MQNYERICSTCGGKEFYPTGLQKCVNCQRRWCREYKARNRTHISSYNKKYKQENKDDIKVYNHHYNIDNRKAIQTRQTKTQRERKKTDANYKISCSLRNRLLGALKAQSTNKVTNTFNLLSCDIKQFTEWLEFQFDEKMTFENHGTYWHMDHCIPCSKWDLTDEENQKRCFHWSNIQPMKALDNIVKNNNMNVTEILTQHNKVNNFARINKIDIDINNDYYNIVNIDILPI